MMCILLYSRLSNSKYFHSNQNNNITHRILPVNVCLSQTWGHSLIHSEKTPCTVCTVSRPKSPLFTSGLFWCWAEWRVQVEKSASSHGPHVVTLFVMGEAMATVKTGEHTQEGFASTNATACIRLMCEINTGSCVGSVFFPSTCWLMVLSSRPFVRLATLWALQR